MLILNVCTVCLLRRGPPFNEVNYSARYEPLIMVELWSMYVYIYRGLEGYVHKVLTCIEYRAVSGVFRTIDPPPLLHPASVSSPRTKGGVNIFNILEDARHWIGLLQYNPSTGSSFRLLGFQLYVYSSIHHLLFRTPIEPIVIKEFLHDEGSR